MPIYAGNADELIESSCPSSDEVFLDDSPPGIYIPLQNAFHGLREQGLTKRRVTT